MTVQLIDEIFDRNIYEGDVEALEDAKASLGRMLKDYVQEHRGAMRPEEVEQVSCSTAMTAWKGGGDVTFTCS